MLWVEKTGPRRSGGGKAFGTVEPAVQTAGHSPLLDYEIGLVFCNLFFPKNERGYQGICVIL